MYVLCLYINIHLDVPSARAPIGNNSVFQKN